MRIDAHQHFWKYSAAEYGWMGDSMAVLKRDHLPGELEKLAGAVGIDGSVAVQARQCPAETEFLLALAKKHSFIKGVVGWVDLRGDEEVLEERLEEYTEDEKFKGVRHVVQDEPDDDFMMRDAFVRGIEKLDEYGLVYDILIYPKQLKCARRLAKKFPMQMFVLDHIAKPFIKKGELQPWKKEMEELARRENVWCKISGMVTEADWKGWKPADFVPYMDAVLEMYGPDRLMFGSDWPVCTVAAKYEQVAAIVQDFIEELSASERDMILGRTAVEFYNLEP
jgi:L-fuconolactonase